MVRLIVLNYKAEVLILHSEPILYFNFNLLDTTKNIPMEDIMGETEITKEKNVGRVVVVDCTIFNTKKNKPIKTMQFPIGISEKIGDDSNLLSKEDTLFKVIKSFIMAGMCGALEEKVYNNFKNEKFGKEENKIIKEFESKYRILVDYNKKYFLRK